jgi:hypothetical protein
MNRRYFLKSGSAAALIAAGLPMANRKTTNDAPLKYKTDTVYGKAGQTEFALIVRSSMIEKFSSSTTDQRVIMMEVSYYEDSNTYVATKSATFKYSVENTELFDKANNIWKVKTKFVEKVKGSYELEKDFPKDLRLLVKPAYYTEILGKKDKSLYSLSYDSTYSAKDDDDGCFLTTACVQERNLPDNCDELETLRYLRETYIRKQEGGTELLSHYRFIGPALISNINQFQNRSLVYDHIYNNLIIPSVKLIKEQKFNEATSFYKEFVIALEAKYLN